MIRSGRSAAASSGNRQEHGQYAVHASGNHYRQSTKVYRNCQVVLQSSVQSVRHQRLQFDIQVLSSFCGSLSVGTNLDHLSCDGDCYFSRCFCFNLKSYRRDNPFQFLFSNIVLFHKLAENSSFFCTASDNPDITCWCGKKLCLYDCVIRCPRVITQQ